MRPADGVPRVLITDHVFPGLEVEHEVLDPLGADIVLAPSADEETLVELAGDADALMVCFAKVTTPVVEAAAANGCGIIARYGIGYDNVDVETATRHGMAVTYVPDYCLDEVADHTMALLLAAARGLVPAVREVAQDGWKIGHEGIHRMSGRTLALIGLGGIGSRVAARARAFGLRVVAYDPYLASAPEGVEATGTMTEALAQADFVSLHAPATAANHHLIDADAIAAMERAPVLINTARGALVDLDAVVGALDQGRLAGAALDVTDPEPLPEGHPLRTHPRAVITPHMAFHSEEATDELQRRTATEVRRALTGEAPDRPVPVVAG